MLRAVIQLYRNQVVGRLGQQVCEARENMGNWAGWHTPAFPGTWEAGTKGSPETKNSRPAWTMYHLREVRVRRWGREQTIKERRCPNGVTPEDIT